MYLYEWHNDPYISVHNGTSLRQYRIGGTRTMAASTLDSVQFTEREAPLFGASLVLTHGPADVMMLPTVSREATGMLICAESRMGSFCSCCRLFR